MTTRIPWVKNPDGSNGEVLNPIQGCTKCAPGCVNCWSVLNAWIKCHNPNDKINKQYTGVVEKVGNKPRWTGALNFNLNVLEKVFGWKKPRTIFLCSQADLFHEKVPDDLIDWVMAHIATTPRHTYLLLTKRPKRMLEYFNDLDRVKKIIERADADTSEEFGCYVHNSLYNHCGEGYRVGWPMNNLWLGTSVSEQDSADRNIPLLLLTPAIKRFVSYEPALGPVDFEHIHAEGRVLGFSSLTGVDHYFNDEWSPLDWIICGSESGSDARPFNEDWARSVRDQCVNAGIPYFYKQATRDGKLIHMPELDGQVWDQIPSLNHDQN